MTNHDRYRHKRASSADAMRHVRNGDTIIVPAGVGEPPSLLTALSAQRLGFLDVKVLQILAMRKYAYLDPQTAGHVRHVALFFGGASRAGGQQGWIDFLPGYFSELPAQINAATSRPMSSSAWPRPWTPMATSPSVSGPTTRWPASPEPARWFDDGSTLQIGCGGISDAVVMLRARGEPLARRQGVHRPGFDGEARFDLAHRLVAEPRHPCQHEQERHQLRRHRVRRGTVARQVCPAARAGIGRRRPPKIPPRVDRAGAPHKTVLTGPAPTHARDCPCPPPPPALPFNFARS